MITQKKKNCQEKGKAKFFFLKEKKYDFLTNSNFYKWKKPMKDRKKWVFVEKNRKNNKKKKINKVVWKVEIPFVVFINRVHSIEKNIFPVADYLWGQIKNGINVFFFY